MLGRYETLTLGHPRSALGILLQAKSPEPWQRSVALPSLGGVQSGGGDLEVFGQKGLVVGEDSFSGLERYHGISSRPIYPGVLLD